MSLLTRENFMSFFFVRSSEPPIIAFNIYFCFADYTWWLSSAFNITLWSFYDSISFLRFFFSSPHLFNKKIARFKNDSQNCLLNNLRELWYFFVFHELQRREMINKNSEKISPRALRFYCFFGGKTKNETRKKVKKGIKNNNDCSFAALLCNFLWLAVGEQYWKNFFLKFQLPMSFSVWFWHCGFHSWLKSIQIAVNFSRTVKHKKSNF